MTDKEKYNELLFGMAELLEKKNADINIRDYEIKTLKSKLETAENEIAKLRKEK